MDELAPSAFVVTSPDIKAGQEAGQTKAGPVPIVPVIAASGNPPYGPPSCWFRIRRRMAALLRELPSSSVWASIADPFHATLPMSDQLQKFVIEKAGVRGVLVQLDAAWAQAQSSADYPPNVASLLGRSMVAVALMTGTIKFRGRLSIQLRTEDALRLLFVECSDQGALRGLARWDGASEVASTLPEGALLAITIEHADSDKRQQGLIAPEGGDLEVAFVHYFEQSEQLPTRIMLVERNGRCAGILLQPLAIDSAAGQRRDEDGWNRVGHLLATLSADELVSLSPNDILLRLFHEEDARVFDPQPLRFECSCSRTRVANMLRSLGKDEVDAALAAEGSIGVTCEFCNRDYRFDAIDAAELFAAPTPVPGSDTAH